MSIFDRPDTYPPTLESVGAVARYQADMIQYGVPETHAESLALYFGAHLQPGHFLTAVLSNNLMDAYGRGDEASIAALPIIIKWLYNRAPGGAWRTRENVVEWLTSKGGD